MKRLLLISLSIWGIILSNLVWDHYATGERGRRGLPVFRSISSWYWIRAYNAWEKKEPIQVIDNYSVATALNPLNMAYWRLATETIALDFPHWESREQGIGLNPDISQAYREKALSFFGRSQPYFRNHPQWFLTARYLSERIFPDPDEAHRYLETVGWLEPAEESSTPGEEYVP